MIKFRIYGLPRSGTTWASNWLTTDQSICWHDPIEWAAPRDIDTWAREQKRIPGISCTGTWQYPRWAPEAVTIKLVRPWQEIQVALARLSLPRVPMHLIDEFQALDYPEFTLRQLMMPDTARHVWNELLPGVEFDSTRHRMLSKMNIQLTDSEMQRIRDRAYSCRP